MGLPEEPVEGVRIENVRLTSNGGGTDDDAACIVLKELGSQLLIPNRVISAPCQPTASMPATSKTWSWPTSPAILTPTICAPAPPLPTSTDWRPDNFKPQVADGGKAAVFADDVKNITVRNSPAVDNNK